MGFDIGFDFDNIFILQRGGDSNPIDVNTPIEFERFDMHVVCLRWCRVCRVGLLNTRHFFLTNYQPGGGRSQILEDTIHLHNLHISQHYVSLCTTVTHTMTTYRTFTLFFVALLATASTAQVAFLGIDEKCSACKAIVYELDRAMRFERPQENIKVGRQVLDSNGKRSVGRVVNYKQSELRAITIIDGLCPTMQHYGKVVKDGESRWMRVNYAEGDVVIDGSMTLGGAQSETEGRALKLYCDRIVEEHEDDWVTATQAGVDKLEERICTTMLELCGKAAVDRVQEEDTKQKLIKAKYKSKLLTMEEKRMNKKIKKVTQLKKDMKRIVRIKKDKIRAQERLLKDIDKYTNQIKTLQQVLNEAEEVLQEEIEAQEQEKKEEAEESKQEM